MGNRAQEEDEEEHSQLLQDGVKTGKDCCSASETHLVCGSWGGQATCPQPVQSVVPPAAIHRSGGERKALFVDPDTPGACLSLIIIIVIITCYSLIVLICVC